ncbi:substrate-binding domain-containing protein [Candidatus Mycoplasma haematohominis]|uniref:PBP superfamily domain protein n=1 Tax=Candidatus Mycoplasma haematohominis TaxID=1494318 RepID=A0A478FPE2_9MOLU|nr:substrate-binding domain-containing protein [Candidatus Mycoplasma haemohominis]GCE63221.1 PBP superfamily domain protein [Candidatus Mycoplasma haemohominis]
MLVSKVVVLTGGVGSLSVWSIYSASAEDANIVVFNFEGSSSMKPIMEFLMSKYQEENKNKREIISFNISSVGSNAGLKKILSGDSSFALVSHDISKLPQDEKYKNKWKSRKLKTITLAKEAMVLIYKPPKGCDKEIVVSSENISKIYSVLSGYSYETQNLTFKSLINENDESGKCDSFIFPWVKSTGPIKSGTAKAFVDNPLLSDFCKSKDNGNKDKCEAWVKNVKSSYGKDFRLNYVPEPTRLHWDNFKSNLQVGAITYLPSHFVFLNWDEISKEGLKIAKYKPNGTDIALTSENFESQINNYTWNRTFNLVYSIDDLNKGKNKELLTSLLTNACLLKDLKIGTFKYSVKKSVEKINGSSSSTECNSDAQEVDLEKQDETEEKVK